MKSRNGMTGLSLLVNIFSLSWAMSGFCQAGSDLHSLITSAQEAQSRQDFSGAAEAYRVAVQLRPDLPELRANLGIMEYEAERFELAAVDLSAAVKMKPTLFSPTLFLGLDQLRLERPKDALPYLKKAEELNPADPQTPIAIGRAESSLRDYAAATAAYQRALALDSKNGPAWFDLGMTYLAQVEQNSLTLSAKPTSFRSALFAESLAGQRRYLEAVEQFSDALNEKPQAPCLQSALGFVYMRQGKMTEAIQRFQSEGALHPECLSAVLGQAAVEFANADTNAGLESLERAWVTDRGYTLANLPSVVDALSPETKQSLQAAIGVENGSRELISVLRLQLSGGELGPSARGEPNLPGMTSALPQPQRAIRAYRSAHYGECAALLSPVSPHEGSGDLLLAARCSYFTGDYRSAATSASLFLKRASSDAEGLYWLVRANQKLALASLEHFRSIAPDSPQTHLLLGDMNRQRENYEDAISEYQIVLSHAADDPAALQGLASAYLSDGKVDAAIETAESALKIRPNDPELNLLLGEALVAEHRFDEAEVCLRKSVLTEKAQLLPQAHAVLGRVYAATNRSAEAIANLKLGLAADQDGSYHYQLARLYVKTGNAAAASVAMSQSKALAEQHRARAVIAVQEAAQPEGSQP